MNKIFFKKWNQYYNEWKKIITENNVFYNDSPNVESVIRMDLDDKGFSQKEIESLLNGKPSTTTAYKFIAYSFTLYEDFYTKSELEEIIEDQNLCEDLTNNDITNILTQRENIDY